MLASRRGCFGYSKIYSGVRKNMVPGMESKQTYCVLHIPYSVY